MGRRDLVILIAAFDGCSLDAGTTSVSVKINELRIAKAMSSGIASVSRTGTPILEPDGRLQNDRSVDCDAEGFTGSRSYLYHWTLLAPFLQVLDYPSRWSFILQFFRL